MKRLLQLLARLYPAEWRARYGAEYAALLEEREPRWRDVVDVAWAAVKLWATSWSFVRVVLPCVIAGGLVAMAVSFEAPVLYTSGSVVIVQSFPEGSDSDSGLAPVESQAPKIPELVRDTFADDDALILLIQRYNLYPVERAKMPLDKVLEKMRSAILVRPVWGSDIDQEIGREKQIPDRAPESVELNKKSISSAFMVEFKYPDPHVAQMVDASLLSLLVGANLRNAEESARVSRPRTSETFSVLYAPSLANKADGRNWAELGAMGLLGGIGCGLMLAALVRMRRGRIAATGLVLLGVLGGVAARGQEVVRASGPLSSFEVATIKPNRGGALPPPMPVSNEFRKMGICLTNPAPRCCVSAGRKILSLK